MYIEIPLYLCTYTVVSLPTGYGKSLILVILPHVFDKLRGNLKFKSLKIAIIVETSISFSCFISFFCLGKHDSSIVIYVTPLTSMDKHDCSSALYITLHQKLGSGYTEPPEYPDLSEFQRVELYAEVS